VFLVTSSTPSDFERVDHVLQNILSCITPIAESEWLPILDASGCVLAQSVAAPESLPAAPVSAMDGYALSARLAATDQSKAKPVQLRVTGKSLAGRQLEGLADPQGAVRIFTGAVVPDCYDCVVPQERAVSTSSDSIVSVMAEDIRAGLHVRPIGEDVRKGDVLLASGQPLGSREIALLAQTGCARVRVHRKLKVSVVSIGDELRDVHQPLNTGLIHDSNRLMLLDLVQRAAAQAIDLGITPDDPASLRSALLHAAGVSDLVMSAGGVSVGEADHTRKVLDEIGEIKFWRPADGGGWNAEVMLSQGAANLLSLAQADGLVVLPHELGALEVGTWVDVISLK